MDRRGALLMRAPGVLLLAMAAGCFDPHYEECKIACGPSGGSVCPGGMICRADNFCHPRSSTRLCTPEDAGSNDLPMSIDLATVDRAIDLGNDFAPDFGTPPDLAQRDLLNRDFLANSDLVHPDLARDFTVLDYAVADQTVILDGTVLDLYQDPDLVFNWCASQQCNIFVCQYGSGCNCNGVACGTAGCMPDGGCSPCSQLTCALGGCQFGSGCSCDGAVCGWAGCNVGSGCTCAGAFCGNGCMADMGCSCIVPPCP